MDAEGNLPPKLSLLSSERPRNLSWFGAGALLFGDWGTSRLYVLGLAFLVAGTTSFYLIAAMSLLILAVGWAYTQICRIYPDGGGVYTAARNRSRILAVVGALLLFADYTITASLSAVEAFHYFGLGRTSTVVVDTTPPGSDIRLEHPPGAATRESIWNWRSPGLWALISILVIGAFNLMGPKHTAFFALLAAGGMVAITLLVVVFALPQVDWKNLDWGQLNQPAVPTWRAFVAIVLALSGVEAIANLTGVMKKPVYGTASKAIWMVALEVALFNLLLAVAMIALASSRHAHTEDMMAFMAGHYVGPWGEWPVRIIGGVLLLSATNTAVNGLMSIVYVMSRDGELPRLFQKLNGWGAPWLGALVAACVPALVLVFMHDVVQLASLYAIGVVGAVAINCTLCSFHPRLRKFRRKAAMAAIAAILMGIWITLAFTKWHALVFVLIVLAVGLLLRAATKWAARRRPRRSLLWDVIVEQLPPGALAKPRLLLATAGSAAMAHPALELARCEGAALVVVFVREVVLNYKVDAETRLRLDTDPAAQAMFVDFLELGHQYGVPIIPMYDTGSNASELIAETAAINNVQRVLIGSSRRGKVHQLIKGSFQRKLEALLPPEIPVQVLASAEAKIG